MALSIDRSCSEDQVLRIVGQPARNVGAMYRTTLWYTGTVVHGWHHANRRVLGTWMPREGDWEGHTSPMWTREPCSEPQLQPESGSDHTIPIWGFPWGACGG